MDTHVLHRSPHTVVAHNHRTAWPAAVGVALATLEGLLGRRALHQLRPWLSPEAFLELVRHVEAGTFCHSCLGRLRVQMPTPTAAEAVARISLGDRWLACTVRLDLLEDRWRCSDLAILGLGLPTRV